MLLEPYVLLRIPQTHHECIHAGIYMKYHSLTDIMAIMYSISI